MNLREAVKCPEDEDENEWLAVNTVVFYNQINLLYGTLVDYCTDESCDLMSAGSKYKYLWADGKKYKKATEVTAPQYVNLLFDSIEAQLDDEKCFPSSADVDWPKNFKNQIVSNIFKRLFRVYAHMYYSHFEKIVGMGEEAHLNTSFKHFYFFIMEFGLVDSKEFGPLEDLIKSIEDSE
eukprot:TRINITY_DN769_c0_g1_i1.p2 TRINITY_DN769_c0_g1~~TRINITY_DN769_c0_g1_i1.p2  ORF type:complete len:179 (-),score=73.98 TRINITY_DN769_c0_g1_i1:113-649(-)